MEQTTPVVPQVPPRPTEEPAAPPAPPTEAASVAAKPDSWWGVVLVALALAGLVGAIVAVWWQVAPRPPNPVERYYPFDDGVTRSYRITNGDGTISYQSSNIERLHGGRVNAQINIATVMRALTILAPETRDGDTATLIAAMNRLTLARVTDTTYTLNGVITPTVSLLLPQPQAISLLVSGPNSFDPPLPLLDIDLPVGEQRMTTGKMNGSQNYTATLTLEAREGLTTPLGQLDDCRRVRFTLDIPRANNFTARVVSWYCAGVGVARQQSNVSTMPGEQIYELIGANTPGLVANSAPLAPLNTALNAQPQGAWPQQRNDTLNPLWGYQERGTNIAITTPPLPMGDLLLYGTRNGGLLAFNRITRTIAWRFQVGGAISGSPVVADGLVYVGSDDRRLYAVDAISGTFRWSFATRDSISASPAVANGLVYIGSQDRTIYALDARTGQERWRVETGGTVTATPTVAAGILYIGSDDGALYALDAATGVKRWVFAAENAITAAPIVADGVVYAGSHDSKLYALKTDPQSREGDLIWTYDAGSALVYNLTWSDGTLSMVTKDSEVRVVDANSGSERWRYRDDGTLYGAPVVLGNRLLVARKSTGILQFDAHSGVLQNTLPTGETANVIFLSSDGQQAFAGDDNGYLQGFGNSDTLPWVVAPRWQATDLRTDMDTDSFGAPPIAYGDRLIYVSLGGRIYSVAAADGSYETLGQAQLDDAVLTPPVVAGDTLYMVDYRGRLSAFDLAQRRKKWQAKTGGRSISPPVVADGQVLLAAAGRRETMAYAFDAATGKLLWKQSPGPNSLFGSHLFYNGRWYVAAGALYALDPASGAVQWQSDGALAPNQLTLLDGVVYGVGYDKDGALAVAGWDAASGRERFRAPISASSFPNPNGALASGAGRLALLLNDGTLIAFDAANGQEIWRRAPISEPRGLPVIDGRRVILATAHNHLIAYDLDDGRLLGDLSLPNENTLQDYSAMSPLILDNQIYVVLGRTALAVTLKEAP